MKVAYLDYSKAIRFNRVNPILAWGAAAANMAICDRFENVDVTRLIQSGDRVNADPEQGPVTVERI